MIKTTVKNSLLVSALIILSVIADVYLYENLETQKMRNENAQNFAREEQVRIETLRRAQEKTYLMGEFDPTTNGNFTVVPNDFVVGTMQGSPIYLRKETLAAFLAMANAAASDGISLKIASATRNFDYQKNMWNKKWDGYSLDQGEDVPKDFPNGMARFARLLLYNAAPGTSRHHWGTDIDLNNANPEYFSTAEGQKVYGWLMNNAARFGFCQPYNLKGSSRPYGYNEEKWHWSYMPLAGKFLEEYKQAVQNTDISGFLGDQYASAFNLVDNYVLSINPSCNGLR